MASDAVSINISIVRHNLSASIDLGASAFQRITEFTAETGLIITA